MMALLSNLFHVLLLATVLCSQGGFGAATELDPSCSVSKDPTMEEPKLEKAGNFERFLSYMYEKVETHRAAMAKPDRRAQEELILNSWMEYMKVDTSGITQVPVTTNWVWDLHRTTQALAPTEFFKIWDERARPTEEEIEILLRMDQNARRAAATESQGETLNQEVLFMHLFVPFRHRGFTMDMLDIFARVLLGTLKTVTFATPGPDNLQTISHYQPLVEVGAGSGYWSAVLQDMGVDIVPYDKDPPQEGKAGTYFDRTYTTVKPGDCQSLFASQPADNRTLLMVWPNNPDNIDNAPEFHSPILPPVWDADCLGTFVAAGGTTLILVAEREANIHVLPNHPQNPTQPDGGLCATRQFQQTLEQDFDLVQQMPIPKWHYQDDLTIWKLKAAIKEE